MSKSNLFLIVAAIILVAGGIVYLFWGQAKKTPPKNTLQNQTFSTYNRTFNNNNNSSTTITTRANPNATTTPGQIPVLRLLSNTPIGGYGASTTATTTIVRWVDRGRGNIYEVAENNLSVSTLSNTLLPRVYASAWNKNLSAFIGSLVQDNSEIVKTVYAGLQSRATYQTSSSASSTKTATGTPVVSQQVSGSVLSLSPYELRGKNLPENTLAFAVSPSKTKVFILIKEGIGSSGYTANFDGTGLSQVFTTPLTQLTVEWPVENTLAITTKGSAQTTGFLYFVDIKTGVWKKILGPVPGLSTKVSHDGKRVFISSGNDQGEIDGIYTIASSTASDVVIQTMADKCVWGNFYTDMIYCAVPFQQVSGMYPDDWYSGTLTTVDKIWQINAATKEAKLINPLIGQAGRNIDAFNLGLDDKDNYLFFMSKNDLSFWSLDLVRSH